MKFILHVRKVDERDLNSGTPFLPDDEDYEMYLNAFQDDLAGIGLVSEIVRTGSIFQIETAQPINSDQLRDVLKPFLQATGANLRFVSLDELLH